MDSLNPSVRCGLSSNARQIRPIVEGERPDFLAIDVRDQWVAFSGVDSNVSTTIFSTWSAVTDGYPARAGVIPEPVQSQFKKPRTPFPDRLLCDAFPGSDFLVRQTFRAAEHDP